MLTIFVMAGRCTSQLIVDGALEQPSDSSKARLLGEGELHRGPLSYGQFTVGQGHHLIVSMR